MNASGYLSVMGVLDRLRSFLGLNARSVALPPGYELKDGIVLATAGSTAPKRGTRELLKAYSEQPRLRSVASRIARGVSSAQVRVYTRTKEPSDAKSRRRSRADHLGTFRDVSLAPAFDWVADRGVRDLSLAWGAPRLRAQRRTDLADAGLLREIPDHPLLDLLAAPNDEMSGRTALLVTQVWLDLKGEAFWLVAREAGGGPPKGFWPIPPHWVKSTPTKQAPYFCVSAGGLEVRVTTDAMIWLRDPDPENPYGRGTGLGESLGDELETDEYAAKYLKNWFFNSAMPAAMVSFEGATIEQVKQMQEKWERDHRGYQNAHRVHFGVGKMNAQRLDASLKDQQMTELRAFSRDTIAQVFGMPPEMIGIIENSNRSTIGAAGYIYAIGVEAPRAEFLRDELQRQLAPMYDAALVIELETPIPEDEARRLDVLQAMPGAFSLNEWRGEAGYDALPQFDGVFPPLELPGQSPATEKPSDPPDDPPPEKDPPADDEKAAPPSSRAIPADPPWVSDL